MRPLWEEQSWNGCDGDDNDDNDGRALARKALEQKMTQV
jgi:hypothetical protein